MSGLFVLAFTLLDFVASEVFLRLGVCRVLACDRIVFTQYEFVWGVLGVLDRVVRTVTAKVTHEADKLALCILLCHFNFLITSALLLKCGLL